MDDTHSDPRKAPGRSGPVAILPESFDPPTATHRGQIVALLEQGFSRVIVHPTAASEVLHEYDHAAPRHRAALVSLAFDDLPGVTIDYDDISLGRRSSLHEIAARHGDAWIVARASTLRGWKRREERLTGLGAAADAAWSRLSVAVVEDVPLASVADTLPGQRRVIHGPAGPSSEAIRGMLVRGESIDGLLPPAVADYVHRHRLFLPGAEARRVELRLDEPRLLIAHDERNPSAAALAERYRRHASSTPTMILVIGGDGTMLRAIREHWRRRLPFLGLNAGHYGFLMNAALPCPLDGVELVSLSLPLLRVDASFPDGGTSTDLAFGDAWVERAEGQSAWLRIGLNGETKLEKVVGDGMLVATPAGSSAYARALGAVPVPIDSPTLTLAGSNIFQPRFWQPMILPAASRIEITSIDTIGKRPLRGYVDGLPLGIVTGLAIRQSLTASVELAFTRAFDPSSKLLESLFPRDAS